MTLMMIMNIGGGFANFDTDDVGTDHDDNDDIYIMMQCLSVCNEKWALS